MHTHSTGLLVRVILIVVFVFASSAHAEKKYHISQDFQVEPTLGGYWVFHNDIDAYVMYGITFDYYFNEFWSLELEALAMEFFMNADLSSDQKNFFRDFEVIPSFISTADFIAKDSTGEQRRLVTNYINSVRRAGLAVPKRSERVSGYGLAIGPRFNFFPTEMGGLFLAMGVGAAVTEDEVPYSGQTSFFTFKTEIGQDLRLTDNFSVLIRMGFRHMGGFDSKRLDAVGGSFGIGYTF